MQLIIHQTTSLLPTQTKSSQRNWKRFVLLFVLGYEAAGCLLGGGFLISAPDGRLMDMPVSILNGAFSDFLIPGIILFSLGILNATAFVAVFRKMHFDWIMIALALGGLLIWFWVEIAILQNLHWLHLMWGLPVLIGGAAAIALSPSRRKALLLCGIFSSVLYILANMVAVILYKGYDPISKTVSELSAIGAPTRPLWIALLTVYSLLTIAFGWGVWQTAGTSRRLRTVGILLTAYAVIGFFWPPMHQREVLAAGGSTISDTLHIVFTLATVPLMMLIISFGALASGKSFKFYSVITLLVLIAAGIFTAFDAPNISKNLPTPWIGVWERINIGVYMLWLAIFAMTVLKREPEP